MHLFGGLTTSDSKKNSNQNDDGINQSSLNEKKPIDTKQKQQKNNDLVMICWQNYSGVRMAKLIPSEKFDVKSDEEFALKISTMGLFFPAFKDQMVQGLKFSNVPRQLKFIPDRLSTRLSPFNKHQRLSFSTLHHPDGTPFNGCPRTLLYRALRDL